MCFQKRGALGKGPRDWKISERLGRTRELTGLDMRN